ncbi:MAG: hypothetical protein ABIK73_07335 [candidate division WOR-3 bacterium]
MSIGNSYLIIARQEIANLCELALWATVFSLFFVGAFTSYFKGFDCSYYIDSLRCLGGQCDEADKFFARALCANIAGDAAACQEYENRKAFK